MRTRIDRRIVSIVAVLLAAAALPAAAQARRTERTVPLDPRGQVFVELFQGSVVAHGWTKDEVRVVASFTTPGAELTVDGSTHEVSIEVEDAHRAGPVAHADLEIWMPVGASFDGEGVKVDFAVDGLAGGDVEIEAVSGRVTVKGDVRVARVEAVSGNIDVAGAIERVEASSASGSLNIQGVRVEVSAESVSGSVEVRAGAPLREAALTSVSGNVRFQGDLEPRGQLTAESVSGDIDITLPKSASATAHLETFSGGLRIDAPGVDPRIGETDEPGPGRSARFAIGSGSARIDLESFSGGIALRAR